MWNKHRGFSLRPKPSSATRFVGARLSLRYGRSPIESVLPTRQFLIPSNDDGHVAGSRPDGGLPSHQFLVPSNRGVARTSYQTRVLRGGRVRRGAPLRGRRPERTSDRASATTSAWPRSVYEQSVATHRRVPASPRIRPSWLVRRGRSPPSPAPSRRSWRGSSRRVPWTGCPRTTGPTRTSAPSSKCFSR